MLEEMVIAHFSRDGGEPHRERLMLWPDPRVGYIGHHKPAGQVSFSLNFTNQEDVLRAIEVAVCGYYR